MPAWLLGLLTAYAAWLLISALVSGRVPAARTFFKLHYAERDASPVIYWLMVLIHAAILAFAGGALAHALNPAIPSLADLI